ncbi:hypothetical protein ACFLT4_03625 [Chloroflexota bacterium]
MRDVGNAIKYLYEKLILRDVLSFITPGAIIVLTSMFLFYPEILYKHVPWPLYIPLFGVFYMAGFAIECLGRIFGLIQIHRLDKSHFLERLMVFCPSWEDKDDTLKLRENWRKHQEEEADVENALKQMGIEAEELTRERLIVLKQMCANGFLAIIIASIFLAVSYCPWTPAKLSIVSTVAILLLASLLWGYRWAKFAVDTREPKILSMLKSNQENKRVS